MPENQVKTIDRKHVIVSLDPDMSFELERKTILPSSWNNELVADLEAACYKNSKGHFSLVTEPLICHRQ
jgi:hypothetical protein